MRESLTIFRKQEILILGFSSIVSGIGNWITMMAILSLVIFKGSGGITETSAIFMAGLLPIMLASPLAGKLADRYDRKLLMIISELGGGLTISVIVFTENIWMIYLAMASQALFISLMTPARQSALPQIVHSKEELEKVNAFFQQLNSILKIAAPIIAGFLLSIINAHQAIIVDIISFLFSAIILSKLPALLPQQEKQAPDPQTATQINQTGKTAKADHAPLHFLWRSNHLRLLFLSSFFTVLIIISFDILGAVYIRDILHGDETFLGLIIGVLGCGSFLVSLLIVFRQRKGQYWRDLVIGNFLLAALPLCMTLGYTIKNPVLIRSIILIGSLLGGFGNGFLLIQINTILQISSPSQMLGRLSGYLEFTLIFGQLFSVVLIPIFIPRIIPPNFFFFGATIALWLLALAIHIQSNKLVQRNSSYPL
jgi:hypothetical protein